ncbi:MAG: M15 family metallopeptidase [Bacillota bacterium]
MKKLVLCLLIALSSIFFFSANFYASSKEALSENIARLASSVELVQVDLSNRKIIVGQNPYLKNTKEPTVYKFRNLDKGFLILVNRSHPAGKDFYNPNMINIAKKLPSTKSELMLDREAAEALAELFDAAKSDGIKNLTVVSGYRSYSYQEGLFKRKVDFYKNQGKSSEEAKALAATVVAIPGTSEHQTGLAIDLASRANLGLEQGFENTPEGRWMRENAHKFGYILRYGKDKQSITKIIYEPWHFRYVGKPHSEIIYKNDFCLEEYIDYLKASKKIEYTSEDNKKFFIYYIEGAGNVDEIEVWAYTGQVVGLSSDNSGGLILTLKLD